MILSLPSVKDRVVEILDLLCRLLHLGEAVLGIVCDVDGPVDLFESIQVLLNDIKVVFVVPLQVDWAGNLFET